MAVPTAAQDLPTAEPPAFPVDTTAVPTVARIAVPTVAQTAVRMAVPTVALMVAQTPTVGRTAEPTPRPDLEIHAS
jgi:hypothetical protein